MLQIQSFPYSDQKNYKTALQIRTRVFVDEQNVDPFIEQDAHEEDALHYIAYLDELPVGAARWRETDRGIKLERFAVLKEYRNRDIGSRILKQVMEDVLPLGKEIYLHAQIRAIRFYEKYHFEISGEPFEEAEIIHYTMVFKG